MSNPGFSLKHVFNNSTHSWDRGSAHKLIVLIFKQSLLEKGMHVERCRSNHKNYLAISKELLKNLWNLGISTVLPLEQILDVWWKRISQMKILKEVPIDCKRCIAPGSLDANFTMVKLILLGFYKILQFQTWQTFNKNWNMSLAVLKISSKC